MMIIANILQPLIDFFEEILKFFHDKAGFSWGFAIIAMTIVIRAAMLPLTIKQYRSMQALQRLSPKIKELQAKYKGDKQRLNQEMMRFYQENKVNPFSSCLPLLLQLPVFISLFYMLRKDLRLDICPDINPPGTSNPKPCGSTDASSFLGIPDITNKATGITLAILVVLYVGSQLGSSLLMMTATTDKNQRIIMLALPFVFVPFIIGFPAGLLVYWITTNLWTVGQQWTLKRFVSHHPGTEPAVATSGGGGGGGGGGSGGRGAPAAANGGGGNGKSGGLFGALASRASAAQQKASEQKPAGGEKAVGGTGKKGRASEPAAVPSDRGSSAGGNAPPPPRSPRKKKKRSGRRR